MTLSITVFRGVRIHGVNGDGVIAVHEGLKDQPPGYGPVNDNLQGDPDIGPDDKAVEKARMVRDEDKLVEAFRDILEPVNPDMVKEGEIALEKGPARRYQ